MAHPALRPLPDQRINRNSKLASLIDREAGFQGDSLTGREGDDGIAGDGQVGAGLDLAACLVSLCSREGGVFKHDSLGERTRDNLHGAHIANRYVNPIAVLGTGCPSLIKRLAR